MAHLTFTEDRLVELGRMAIRLSNQYMDYRQKEGIIHHLLFGAMESVFGHMEREYLASRGQERIDFRYGTSNPRVIELVVRDPIHRNQHYGTQNRSELRKLYRVSNAKARARILLILDASGLGPFRKVNLERSFRSVHGERGRFRRYSVTVHYVHLNTDYRFRWP